MRTLAKVLCRKAGNGLAMAAPMGSMSSAPIPAASPARLKLFISHASEDKPGFVEPLAISLGESFDVWYDKFVLKMGDSLLQKISEGLSNADYGVVVLSPAFFNKRWPQQELNGLFALEQAGKMILPVWKDIDEKGVRSHSPILADRVAVLASNGVPHVVSEIKFAVGIGTRATQLSRFDPLAKLKTLDARLHSRQKADELLSTVNGANLVRSEFEWLLLRLEALVAVHSQGAAALKIISRRRNGHLELLTAPRLIVRLRMDGDGYNHARDAVLTCTYSQRGEMGSNDQMEPSLLEEDQFAPGFDSNGAAVWSRDIEPKEGPLTSTEVADLILASLCRIIEVESKY